MPRTPRTTPAPTCIDTDNGAGDVDGNGCLDWEEFLDVVASSRLEKNKDSWWRRWFFTENKSMDGLACPDFPRLTVGQAAFYRECFEGMDGDRDRVRCRCTRPP